MTTGLRAFPIAFPTATCSATIALMLVVVAHASGCRTRATVATLDASVSGAAPPDEGGAILVDTLALLTRSPTSRTPLRVAAAEGGATRYTYNLPIVGEADLDIFPAPAGAWRWQVRCDESFLAVTDSPPDAMIYFASTYYRVTSGPLEGAYVALPVLAAAGPPWCWIETLAYAKAARTMLAAQMCPPPPPSWRTACEKQYRVTYPELARRGMGTSFRMTPDCDAVLEFWNRASIDAAERRVAVCRSRVSDGGVSAEFE